MKYQFWKSLVITFIIIGLLFWLYVLADTYLYAVSVILNSILVVFGFIFIFLLVFCVVYAEPRTKREMSPWEEECKRHR